MTKIEKIENLLLLFSREFHKNTTFEDRMGIARLPQKMVYFIATNEWVIPRLVTYFELLERGKDCVTNFAALFLDGGAKAKNSFLANTVIKESIYLIFLI